MFLLSLGSSLASSLGRLRVVLSSRLWGFGGFGGFGVLLSLLFLPRVLLAQVEQQQQVFSPRVVDVRQLSYWDSRSWDYALVDLRQPADYRRGHIPGAINIPWPTLTRRVIHELRSEVVVLYSHSQDLTSVISHKFPYRVYALLGNGSQDRAGRSSGFSVGRYSRSRSGRSSGNLSGSFSQALSGGLSTWSRAGQPVVVGELGGFADSEQRSLFMDGPANRERTAVQSARSPYFEGAYTSGRPGPYADRAKRPQRGRRNYRNKQSRLRPRYWRNGKLRRRARLIPTR